MPATLNMVLQNLSDLCIPHRFLLTDVRDLPFADCIDGAAPLDGYFSHPMPESTYRPTKSTLYFANSKPDYARDNLGGDVIHLVYLNEDAPGDFSMFYHNTAVSSPDIFLGKSALGLLDLLSLTRDFLLVIAKQRWIAHLSIDRNDSIQRLADLLARTLKTPLLVFSRGMRILARSTDFQCNEDFWYESVEKGYLSISGDHLNDLKKLSSLSGSASRPFRFEFSDGSHSIISSTLKPCGGEPVGVMHVYESERHLSPSEIDFIEILSSYITLAILNSHAAALGNATPSDLLLEDLLARNIATEDALKARLSRRGYKFPSIFRLAVVKPGPEFAVTEMLRKESGQVKLILPSSACAIFEKTIAVLISANAEEELTKEERVRMEAFLLSSDMYCGISRESSDLLDVPKLYRQAAQAIRLGTAANGTSQRIHCFKDVAVLDFFDNCVSSTTLDSYIHPSDPLLSAYDKNHQSELIKTLRVFLKCNGNKTEAASMLQIHRSTLLYRLEKIEEIGHVSLDDEIDLFGIRLSFHLLDYQKTMQENDMFGV